MKKVIIIEDEKYAYEKLALLLSRIDPNIEIVGWGRTLEEAAVLVKEEPDIDLGFFDIQLSDGVSFKLFELVNINFPVIFVTAYDQYAIKAFKHNGIDYILKPIQREDLRLSLEKYQQLQRPGKELIATLTNQQYINQNKYKERFTVKVGEYIKMIKTVDIACFYSYDKATFILTQKDRNYVIDYSLDEVYHYLNKALFFKVSRKFIININQIKDIIVYSNSRLKIYVNGDTEDEIIVSREKVNAFKRWING